MNKYYIIVIVMTLILFTGCITPNVVQDSYLPDGAANVVAKGNNWYEFDLMVDGKNKKFLYFRHGIGDNLTAGVTQVN